MAKKFSRIICIDVELLLQAAVLLNWREYINQSI